MTTLTRPRAHRVTPDSHGFPTRPYDLVKEFVLALAAIVVLTAVLAAVFGSPDEKALTLQDWAKAAPNDVVATAVAELSGDSTSASYGAPYNSAATGQTLVGVPLQKWAGVRYPVDSAHDLVLTPLQRASTDPAVVKALGEWSVATTAQRAQWATTYEAALGKAQGGDPAKVASGQYGPVPAIASGFERLAASGGLEQQLGGSTFYRSDPSRQLLLLADGTYLEDQARARSLGGDQWGMMNETGNYPGQPWLWLYTFWYQVPPFSTSDNADALVWGLMMLLTLGLVLVPFIPGLRDLPRWIPVHRLVWRDWYRRNGRGANSHT